MSRRAIATGLLVASLGTVPGCATILRGTKQDITIETDPPGATIRHLRTGETWSAPVELRLPRGKRHEFLATLDGHESAQFRLRSEASIRWWYINYFTTLLIGNGIDALTGALFDLSPKRVRVVLEPESELQTSKRLTPTSSTSASRNQAPKRRLYQKAEATQ